MKKLLHAIVEGDVQGVGFRYNVFHIASGFKITGTVCNLSDGSVEIFAEGEEKELMAFLSQINLKRGGIRVDNIKSTWHPFSGKYDNFQIIRGNFL